MSGHTTPARVVTVVDLEIQNILSVQNALRTIGAQVRIAKDAAGIADADFLVLPGVGSLGTAAARLHGSGMADAMLTGGSDATPLLSTTPALGILMAAAALLIALAVGAAAARLVGTMAGLTTAGLIVAWATWRTGTVDELVRTAQSGRPLVSLAIEGLIFGVLLVAMAYAVRLAGGAEGRRAVRPAETPKPKLGGWILAIPAGILAGWL